MGVVQRRNRAYLDALVPKDGEQRERFEKNHPISNLAPLPRARAPRSAHVGLDIDAIHAKQPVPLEKQVLSAVGHILHLHPRVSYALRINSGAASYEAKSGKYAPVWFHIWVRSPEKCRMPDFFGAMIDGRALALECKRPGWKKPTDQREREQAAFLELIRSLGGIGAFVTSADEAAAHLL